jgi:phospholipid N-methyltransferase
MFVLLVIMSYLVEPLTEDEYADSFKIFSEKSGEYPMMLNILLNQIDTSQRVKILSIGAGTGYFDVQFLKHLNNFEYYAIEPNNIHVDKLKFTLKKFHNIHIIHDYFTTNTSLTEQFDIILFCHSLYPIYNYSEIIQHASSFLNSTGKIIIFHQSSIGMYQFVTHFQKYITFTKTPLAIHNYCGDDIVKSLGSNYLCQTFTLDTFVNFSGIINDFVKLHQMLTFFLQTKTFLFPNSFFKELLNILGQQLIDTNYIHKNNMIIIQNI